MADRKVGAPLFGGHLDSIFCHSNKPALATIPKTLAGNARLYWEMIKGDAVSTTQPLCSPLNSRGLVGEDHSGVGFGASIKQPLFLLTGNRSDNHSGGVQEKLALYHSTGQPETMYGPDFTTRAFIPSCYPGGYYDTVTVRWLVEVVTAGDTGDEAELQVYSDYLSRSSNSVSLTADASSTGYVEDSGTLKVRPGAINLIRFRTILSAGATTTIKVRILCVMLYNTN